jgi:O-antigen/teichoic acid export membrane protein
MARMIGPAGIGVFIAVTAFTSVLLIVVQLGLPPALLQAKSLQTGQANAAFATIALLSCLAIVVLVLAAPWVARAFDSDQFVPVMYAMCMVFMLTPYTAVGIALLQREMEYDTVAKINLRALFLSTGLSVVAVLAGADVYALVLGAVAHVAITALGVAARSSWRPGFPRFNLLLGLRRYALLSFLNNTLEIAQNRVAQVLVGTGQGTAMLGLYNRAYSLSRMPVEQFSGSVGPLLFGALSRIQSDRDWSRQFFLKAIGTLAAAVLPFLAVLLVAGRETVLLLYGPAWEESGLPLQIMTIGASVLIFTESLRRLIYAQALLPALLPIQLLILVATAGAAWLGGLAYGVIGIAVAMVARDLVAALLLLRVLNTGRLNLGINQVLYAVAPALIASAAAVVATESALAVFLVDTSGNLATLMVAAITTFATYGLVLGVLMLTWSDHAPLMSARELLLQGTVKLMQMVRAS